MRYLALSVCLLGGACIQAPPSSGSQPPATAARSADTVTSTINWYTLPVNYVRMGQETVADGGTPTKKRVVLLHYGGMDSSEWKDVQTTLANSYNYDVVAIDIMGHGKTPCPDKYVSIGMQGEIVATVMDGLGWTDAHFVGIGVGGQIAAHMAFAQPQRLKSMTIMSASGLAVMLGVLTPFGIVHDGPPNVPLASPDPVNPLFAFPQICVPSFCPNAPPIWPPGSTAAAKAAFGIMLAKNKSIVTDQFAQAAFQAELNRSCMIVNERMARDGTPNFSDAIDVNNLSKITVPTNIIWGDQDAVLKPGPWTSAWSKIPGSKVQMLAGCGTDLPRDCPADLAPALKTFIDAH